MTSVRRAGWIVIACVALLGLTGCLRVGGTYVINTVDDVAMSMDVSVDKPDFGIPIPGMSPKMVCDRVADQLPQATRTPYENDKVVGCKATLKGKADVVAPGVISLKEDVWTFHQSPANLGVQLQSATVTNFSLSVTFPGQVLTHSGASTVRDTTVTWNQVSDLTSGDGLLATAKDRPKPVVEQVVSNFQWWWLLVGGFVIVFLITALVMGFWALRKRAPRNIESERTRKTVTGLPPAGGWHEHPQSPVHQKTPLDPPRW